MKKLVIIGSGIAGNLASIYFQKQFPDLDITLVGKNDKKRPIVGESTVELTTHFLEALGLGALLEEKHYHKYGLTYYFKLKPDSTCRRYAIHEAPGVIRMPAYNLNRTTFDQDIRDLNLDLGVRAIHTDVADIIFSPDKSQTKHLIKLKEPVDGLDTLDADWVIDATGRNRLIARKLKLNKQAPYQRSSFWFRLKRFDRTHLFNIEAIKPKHHTFDSYYVTHHFYGKGYWIWLIPMRSETGEDLISIGITFRTEIMNGEVSTLEEFLEKMVNDHPVIAELVRSGEVIDTNLYRNYMYESEQYYSREGWFLIGDSGFTFDPANSAGLAYLAHQIPQVAAMIKKDMVGQLTDAYIQCHEAHLSAQLSLQDAWSKWYEIMHDPLKMAWTLLVANLGYFQISLPNYVNGGFLDGHQAKHFAFLLPRFTPETQPTPYPFPCLIDAVAASYNEADPSCMPNLYSKTVNWDLYVPNENARSKYAARYFWMLAYMRLKLMRMVKWQPSVKHVGLFIKHSKGVLIDLSNSIALRLFPSLFYKYGPSPESLASPFQPRSSFLTCKPHNQARVAPLRKMNGLKINPNK